MLLLSIPWECRCYVMRSHLIHVHRLQSTKMGRGEKKQRNHIHTPNTFTQPVIKLTFSYFQQNFLPFEHNISFFFLLLPLHHKHWFWCTARSLSTILSTGRRSLQWNQPFQHTYRCLGFFPDHCMRTKRWTNWSTLCTKDWKWTHVSFFRFFLSALIFGGTV